MKKFFITLLPLLAGGRILSSCSCNKYQDADIKKQEVISKEEEKDDKSYVITFKDDSGLLLSTEIVGEGSLPSYSKGVPTKESTEMDDFVFVGWEPDLARATKDTTYTAKFRAVEEDAGLFYDGGKIDFDTLVANGNITLELIEGTENYKIVSQTLDSLNLNDSRLVIPRKYNGKRVYAIGDMVFANNNCLDEVVFPRTLKIIGDYAFDSSHLLRVELPSNLETVGDNVFTEAEYLEEVWVNCINATIGQSLFLSCFDLTDVHLGDGLQEISYYMLQETAISEITLPSSLKAIREDGFFECSSLTSITLPEGLEFIDYDAFSYSGLTSITIPSTVTFLDQAFNECYDLEYAVINGGGDLQLREYAFAGSGVSNIFYKGSQSEWENSVELLEHDYSTGRQLPDDGFIGSDIEVKYYSETSSSGCWHFVNNEPVLW